MFRGCLACFLALCVAGAPGDAQSAWFGLFGEDDPIPVPAPDALPYETQFKTGNSDLDALLREGSDLYRLRNEPPPGGDGLALRVAADLPRLLDVLWAEGYYNARIRALVAGQPVGLSGTGVDRAAQAADKLRGSAVAPVQIEAVPGEQFRFRTLAFIDSRSRQPLATSLLPPASKLAAAGDPAKSGAVLVLESRIVDALRAQSHPLARIVKTEPVVRHAEAVVDVTIAVDPGPQAGIGPIAVSGTQSFDASIVRSFIYLEEGESYSPDKIATLRKSVGNIEMVGSVRILEADKLDAHGNVPLEVVVGERKQHLVSASAQYSTVDGPSTRVAWTDRNLFGGAERLRLEAIAGVSALRGGNRTSPDWFDPARLTGRVGASFVKPALWGTRNDLLADVFVVREATDTYTSSLVNATTAIRHRFGEGFYVQAGAEFEHGRSTDEVRNIDYTLIGIPLSAAFDNTDNAFDPSKGFRITASAGAYPQSLGSSVDLYQAKVQASAYYAVDDNARTIIAGRVAFGSLGGSATAALPDNRRFYAGGGGSVRGFAYRSLSPLDASGKAIGGRSLFEASLEARIKVTDTIGVVPFIDAGGAFTKSYPDFGGGLRYAAGIGLRYYTGFGPIRLDVATPLDRRRGESPFAVYVSVGQAF